MMRPIERDSLIEAAVVVPVYRNDEGVARLILVRRSFGGVHGGQLAFPGGKRESGDDSLLETAIRETREEIGLIVSPTNLLAELPQATTKTTGFLISPFLCRITPPQRWRVSEREIAEILDVNLENLGQQCPQTMKMTQDLSGDPHECQPYYTIGQHKLWGVTYRILQSLMAGFKENEWLL